MSYFITISAPFSSFSDLTIISLCISVIVYLKVELFAFTCMKNYWQLIFHCDSTVYDTKIKLHILFIIKLKSVIFVELIKLF